MHPLGRWNGDCGLKQWKKLRQNHERATQVECQSPIQKHGFPDVYISKFRI